MNKCQRISFNRSFNQVLLKILQTQTNLKMKPPEMSLKLQLFDMNPNPNQRQTLINHELTQMEPEGTPFGLTLIEL